MEKAPGRWMRGGVGNRTGSSPRWGREEKGEGREAGSRKRGPPGASCASLPPSRAWGTARQRAGPGAVGGGRVCGEPAPQFKGEAGSSPRREEKELSGLWQLRARGAAGRGGWRGEESLAQSRLGPPPAPRPGPSALPPALPCPVRARRGDRQSSRGRAAGHGAAVLGDLRGPAVTSGQSPNLSWFPLLHPENGTTNSAARGGRSTGDGAVRRGGGGPVTAPPPHNVGVNTAF